MDVITPETLALGEDCRLGACSIIRDSALANHIVVAPFTMIDDSKIDNEAKVGPYARLRMDNHLGPVSQVGNFVEVKKTRLGAG